MIYILVFCSRYDRAIRRSRIAGRLYIPIWSQNRSWIRFPDRRETLPHADAAQIRHRLFPMPSPFLCPVL